VKPAKIIVCQCKHCKYVRAKRKNRKMKKKVKRWMNKKRRKTEDEYITHYWA